MVSERGTVKRLIDDAARRHLLPIGLRQKGRSRIWFDDRGWSLITVEFQPGYGVGTYLNIAATWLWYDHGRGVLTFDEGGRVWWRDDGTFATEPPLGVPGWHQWANFIRDHLFAKEMEILADVAAQRVRQIRDQFPDPCATARQLAARPMRRGEYALWHAYHTGAAHALCGDHDAARQAFRRIDSTDDNIDWRREAHRRATELSLIDSSTDLRQRIISAIQTTRHQLALTPWTPPADWS